MPIYEYKCNACGDVTEILQGVGGNREVPKCENCGSEDVEKMWSSFAAVMAGGEGVSEGSCCGLTTPCDNPKRCCGR